MVYKINYKKRKQKTQQSKHAGLEHKTWCYPEEKIESGLSCKAKKIPPIGIQNIQFFGMGNTTGIAFFSFSCYAEGACSFVASAPLLRWCFLTAFRVWCFWVRHV
jgi:hypothetical protein